MNLPKPSEVLRAARKLIERPSCWIKGQYRITDEIGAVCGRCAAGAIEDAEIALGFWPGGAILTGSRLMVHDRAYEALAKQGARFAGGQETVTRANDAPGTTHENVLEMFDNAIIVLEIQHQ